MNLRGLECCGGAELVGINESGWTPERYLLHYTDSSELMKGRGKAFITFSYAWDVKRQGTGLRTYAQGKKRLKAWKSFIEDKDLGTVTIPRRSQYNPNYGKTIRLRAGIWVPDNEACRTYLIARDLRKKDSIQFNGLQW